MKYGMVFLFLFPLVLAQAQPVQKISFTGYAQGTTYAITYFASDSVVKQYSIDTLLAHLDKSLSIYQPHSVITAFNKSDSGCTIDGHLKKVIQKAILINKTTNGIFDITIGAITSAWGFGAFKPATLPDSGTIKQLLACTGFSLVSLNKSFLGKKKSCVQLDVNGIAQGYCVDVLAAMLESNGIKNYIIELGGEIRVRGKKSNGQLFQVAVEVPDSAGIISDIPILIHFKKGAVTTSGNYRKFYESNGKKISHIIDARTGWPSVNELISVTVYAKDAVTADGYDNAIMVMGLQKGLMFIEQHKELAALFIFKKPDGTIAHIASKRFLKLMAP